jgi:hypothetical protein
VAEETKPSVFANVVNLIKALAWPLIVAYVLIQFSKPLSDTVNLLPDLIGHANKLSAGGVTLEIERQAQASGNASLAKALKGLTPDARKLLLQIGQSDWILWYKSVGQDAVQFSSLIDRRTLDELKERSLITYREDPSDFERFVQSLGTVTTATQNGSLSLTLKASKPLTPDQEKRLLNQGVKLSPLGLTAYSVILDVVVHS